MDAARLALIMGNVGAHMDDPVKVQVNEPGNLLNGKIFSIKYVKRLHDEVNGKFIVWIQVTED